MQPPRLNVLLIGAGGIGTQIIQPLLSTFGPRIALTIMDGDIVEENNLNRQAFAAPWLGVNKAMALCADHQALAKRVKATLTAKPEYLYDNQPIEFTPEPDVVLIAVDNNRCRRYAWRRFSDKLVITMANETETAMAYVTGRCGSITIDQNHPAWPTKRWAELANTVGDVIDDPTGCHQKVVSGTPQLAMANHTAASLGLNLMYLWTTTVPCILECKAKDIVDKAVKNQAILLGAGPMWSLRETLNTHVGNT